MVRVRAVLNGQQTASAAVFSYNHSTVSASSSALIKTLPIPFFQQNFPYTPSYIHTCIQTHALSQIYTHPVVHITPKLLSQTIANFYIKQTRALLAFTWCPFSSHLSKISPIFSYFLKMAFQVHICIVCQSAVIG